MRGPWLLSLLLWSIGSFPTVPGAATRDGPAAPPQRERPRFASLWTQMLARKKRWKSDRTPGKGEMYHWVKWPHAGLQNVVTGRSEAEKYEGPVQNSGHYVRGAAEDWDDRKKYLPDEPFYRLPKIGDNPKNYRTGGLPIPCDTPFKCKARLRDKQVSCCQICPDELYLPPDRYYGANEHLEHDPFEPFTRDMPMAQTVKTESESASESLSLSDSAADSDRTDTCEPPIDDDFVLPCCTVCPGESPEDNKDKSKPLKGLMIEKPRTRKKPSKGFGISGGPTDLKNAPFYGNEFTGFTRYPHLTGSSLAHGDSDNPDDAHFTSSSMGHMGGVLLEEATSMKGKSGRRRGRGGRAPVIKPGPDYYFDDFSNNYGQPKAVDIDGKPRTAGPWDPEKVKNPKQTNPVCCGGGYACCRWCPTICDSLERSSEVLPKLWWSLCASHDDWGVAQSVSGQPDQPSAALPEENGPV